jgi:hypothetical protein
MAINGIEIIKPNKKDPYFLVNSRNFIVLF